MGLNSGCFWERYFVIVLTSLALISAQVPFFQNSAPNRNQWALSPSARCKLLFFFVFSIESEIL